MTTAYPTADKSIAGPAIGAIRNLRETAKLAIDHPSLSLQRALNNTMGETGDCIDIREAVIAGLAMVLRPALASYFIVDCPEAATTVRYDERADIYILRSYHDAGYTYTRRTMYDACSTIVREAVYLRRLDFTA